MAQFLITMILILSATAVLLLLSDNVFKFRFLSKLSLKFNAGLSRQSERCEFLDSQQNSKRAKILAIPLALTVCAADKKVSDCEAAFIQNWAKNNVSKSVRNFKIKIKRAVAYFRAGNEVDTCEICKKIMCFASRADCYDIIEFCLKAVEINSVASLDQLFLLKQISQWLKINNEKFISMMEKILPARMHEVENTEIILGITPGMNEDLTRELLNKQYRKWNARVTNPDARIQAQAGHMLELIGVARNDCID